MNAIDIGILILLGVFAFIAWRKGFIMACFSFLPTWVALFASYKIYPAMSKYLRTTRLFDSMKDGIYQSLHLENIVTEQTWSTQNDLIQQMNLPEFLKNALLENNNTVVYDILNVDKIQDYISGFLANIGINILSILIAFLVVYIGLKLILKALDLVAKLPVLSAFNKLGGLVVGLAQGVVVIWIIGFVLTFFYSNPKFQTVFAMLYDSTLGLWFYENNFLLFMILKIFS